MKCKQLARVAAFMLAIPLTAGPGPGPVGSFRPLANFNVPGLGGVSSAEIVSATPDGQILVYTDAVSRKIGLVDLTNPAEPAQVGSIDLAVPAFNLTPTSVAVLPTGTHAVVAAQPGKLLLVRLSPFAVVGALEVGVGPDAVALAGGRRGTRRDRRD